MEQFFRCTTKTEFEDDKGRVKYRKENYIVSALTPTDVEAKMNKHLGTTDFELVNVALTNIIEVIK